MPAGDVNPTVATGTLAVQVQGAADADGALRGLHAARRDLLTLLAGDLEGDVTSGAARVSPAAPAPGGPLLVLHGLVDPRPEALPGAFDLITRRLEQAGLRDASLATVPLGGRLDRLGDTPNAAVLRLFPPPLGTEATVNPTWLDAAVEWLTEGLGELDTVRLRLLGVEFAVAATSAATVLQDAAAARAWCDVVRGDLQDRVQVVALTFGALPHVALAAGGPGVDTAGLKARWATLCDVGRELASSVAYACANLEASLAGLPAGLSAASPPGAGWRDAGGAPPNGVAAWLLDDRVPDVFPFQVIGPGHRAVLAADGPDALEAATALGDGRSEVVLGALEEWLPASPDRADAHAAGVATLAPLLVSDAAFDDLVAARFGDGPIAAVDGADLPGAEDAVAGELEAPPDLTSVVLDARPHRRRGTRLSLLELVAWLAGEPHGEEPRRVSRPLATFARWWALGLDDASRQTLITRAPALAASGTSEVAEAERRWALTEWLARVQAGTWLHAAGLTESADRLAEPGALDAEHTLLDTVDLLTRAATVAAVRLQLTLDVAVAGVPAADAGPRRDHLETVAWAAWEQVQEHVGWVAASEAAIHDDPGELGSSADQRVIDHCRAATAAEPGASLSSVTDELWAIVTAALVDAAWHAGWLAADEVAGTAANTDLRGAALSGEVPAWERLVAVDRVEATLLAQDAAHGTLLGLARSYVEGDEPDQPAWDLAVKAARDAPGTEAWRAAVDDVRQRAGEAVWAQAMAAARSRVTQTLLRSSDLLGRVALVATAREAAGAAARVVAAKGAAVAAADGADEDAVADAAVDALRPIAGDLARAALALLDRLLGYTDPDFAITSSTFGAGSAGPAGPVPTPQDLPEPLP